MYYLINLISIFSKYHFVNFLYYSDRITGISKKIFHEEESI